jgi:hypothetical protein
MVQSVPAVLEPINARLSLPRSHEVNAPRRQDVGLARGALQSLRLFRCPYFSAHTREVAFGQAEKVFRGMFPSARNRMNY